MKFFGDCGRICEKFMVQGQWRATPILHSIQHLIGMNGIRSEPQEQLEDEDTTLK